MQGLALRQSVRSVRNPHWDNIRYCSGTLIVLIHLTAPLLDFSLIKWIYIATWAFRVPVFAMLAGYFSTAGPLTRRDTRRLVESVVVPYLLLSLLHTLQVRYYSGRWDAYIEVPAYNLWFLVSLFFWRMALPYLARLRYPLLLSVLGALGAGYLDHVGRYFAASHTVTALPFFLLGWMLHRGWATTLLQARWSRYAAVGLVAATALGSWVVKDDVKTTWLGMLGPYEQEGLPIDLEWAWIMRAGLLGLGMVVGLCFIRLVPTRRIPFVTYLGAGGFYIYLLHPLILRPFQASGPGLDWVDSKPEQVVAILLAVALASLLASPPVRAVTRPIIQPSWPWLFTRDPDPESSKEGPGDRAGHRVRTDA